MINAVHSSSYGTGLSSLSPRRGGGEGLDPEEARLKETCSEFEAVMTSMVFKEGLKSAQEAGCISEGDDDRDNGSKQYMDFINEQMAYHMGRQGMLGLGDQIYNSVKDRIKSASEAQAAKKQIHQENDK